MINCRKSASVSTSISIQLLFHLLCEANRKYLDRERKVISSHSALDIVLNYCFSVYDTAWKKLADWICHAALSILIQNRECLMKKVTLFKVFTKTWRVWHFWYFITDSTNYNNVLTEKILARCWSQVAKHKPGVIWLLLRAWLQIYAHMPNSSIWPQAVVTS